MGKKKERERERERERDSKEYAIPSLDTGGGGSDRIERGNKLSGLH
jgi:hypothetical protein